MEEEKKAHGEGVLSSEALWNVDKHEKEFTGIDMLISTPESMNELRTRLDEARKKEEKIALQAREVHEEVGKLERLIKYLESKPTAKSDVANEDNHPICLESGDLANEYPMAGNAGLFNQGISKGNSPDDENMDENYYKKRRLKFWAFVILGGILLAAASIQVYRYITDDTQENIEVIYGESSLIAEPQREYGKSVSDSVDGAVGKSSGSDLQRKEDTAKPVVTRPEDAVNPSRKTENEKNDVALKSAMKRAAPLTYTIQKGETLYGISKRFYGTTDSIDAIIRVNNFKNPNSISYGITIKLP
ncbi:MAG: LysM peptidoglycan-binding domain-containing protein [Bacteroides sp.]|nr:LysM peptidoglycan-binding domain-containing protein [Roseburia sp.]MCM1346044.1 LysM peptidoglycan-binding domain-containing protein [Bacteroides sp.]MCM1420205.1 LysM peptidoglycan-binding domain-containing protein [Bacteroides sp.]